MTPQTYYCSECGRPTAPEELARFGDRLVCPYCKDAYAQKLREGAAYGAPVRYGGFWLRWVGLLIDAIILMIPIGILAVLMVAPMMGGLAQLGPNPTPDQFMAFFAPMMGGIFLIGIVGFVLEIVYEAVFVMKFGATPGKMALGLKVIRRDGSGLAAGRAFGRAAAKYGYNLIPFFGSIIALVSAIMCGVDDQKQSLHDRLCDTRVIKARG